MFSSSVLNKAITKCLLLHSISNSMEEDTKNHDTANQLSSEHSKVKYIRLISNFNMQQQIHC